MRQVRNMYQYTQNNQNKQIKLIKNCKNILTYQKQSAIIKTTKKEKQKGAENSRQEIRERNGFQKI